MVFCFVQNFFSDNTRVRIIFFARKARIFFPEFNIRLYDKYSESDYYFFLHQNQNIFLSNIGNQNIFLEKNHNPPLQVKWSFPKFFKYMICRFIFSQTSKPRPGVCPAIRKVSKDFCARAFVVSDCKGKDSDCPKGIPLERVQRVFFTFPTIPSRKLILSTMAPSRKTRRNR